MCVQLQGNNSAQLTSVIGDPHQILNEAPSDLNIALAQHQLLYEPFPRQHNTNSTLALRYGTSQISDDTIHPIIFRV